MSYNQEATQAAVLSMGHRRDAGRSLPAAPEEFRHVVSQYTHFRVESLRMAVSLCGSLPVSMTPDEVVNRVTQIADRLKGYLDSFSRQDDATSKR